MENLTYDTARCFDSFVLDKELVFRWRSFMRPANGIRRSRNLRDAADET